jgi:alkanesulfonate monooxygenase SsuD/methylene tetrahydromethanopterin reductase-like flavin-dependent oxidoreductase (luciferase family)
VQELGELDPVGDLVTRRRDGDGTSILSDDKIWMGCDGDVRGVGLSLPVQDELNPATYLRPAVQAEEAGLDAVTCGEIAGPETFAMLGAIAARTSRVQLGTAIISTFTRSAALAAMGFATLDDLAPGRVVAGIGSGSPVIVEGWHGGSLTHPLRRAREYVGDLRTALAGGAVHPVRVGVRAVDVADSVQVAAAWRRSPPSWAGSTGSS